ncbi:guanine nucleotide exchange factor 10-like protein [Kappamyces sp. JEL0680]|nr:guanine nucleotide exchange factor 10-like protein [Kappamyces sp. JEL0680]
MISGETHPQESDTLLAPVGGGKPVTGYNITAPAIPVNLSVYPAMLSQVAKSFQQTVATGIHVKDMLEYNDCFPGKHGVDTICKLIKTKDRNISILLGRALDAQGFFHDVTWTHRLRDSSHEFYKFEEIDGMALAGGNHGSLSSRLDRHQIAVRVSKKEVGRQEVIFEIISTEKEFVKDLENTIKHYIEPLKVRGIINPPERRLEFIKQVFSNIAELYNINSKLLKKLVTRQKEAYVVDKIGDIFVNSLHEAYPYVEYGAQQVFAKAILDDERQMNPEFAKFLKETEKLPDFRKLPIESFLARPTTRLGRYPLLLKPVMEKALDNHPDRTLIPQALADLKSLLSNINIEAGKAENTVKLGKLQKQIIGTDEDTDVLRLAEEGRQVIRDGKLIMKRASLSDVELTVFLFDHCFLVTKKKENSYKISRKPIPLELISIVQERNLFNQPFSPQTQASDPSKTFSISFNVPSRYGGPFFLYALTHSDRVSWIDAIEKQKAFLIEHKKRFETTTLVTNYFMRSNPVNCCCSYGKYLFVGTDSGLYVGGSSDEVMASVDFGFQKFVKVVDLDKIYQLDIIPKIDMLLVLQDKTLVSYPLKSVIESFEGYVHEKFRPKKIGSNVTFFRQGVCNNMALVCTVKSTTLTATIKVLAPVGLGVSNLHGKIGKMFRTANESLRLEKEFYIPSESKSIHFLNTKLCVGCTKGFELVELDTLATQALLDPSDEALEFVIKKESVRPIAIFRMKDGNFLLCYNDFGFFIDKLGRRAKREWIVYWSGNPSSFSFMHPYIIAYEAMFIEIRHIETGQLQQVIHTPNLKVLSVDPALTYCVAESVDSPEFQTVFKLRQLHDTSS